MTSLIKYFSTTTFYFQEIPLGRSANGSEIEYVAP